MRLVNCYDIISIVVEDATRKYHLDTLTQSEIDSLKSRCSWIEARAAGLSSNGYQVDYDKDSSDIVVSIFCDGKIAETHKLSYLHKKEATR